jgi:hypothetical protein
MILPIGIVVMVLSPVLIPALITGLRVVANPRRTSRRFEALIRRQTAALATN